MGMLMKRIELLLAVSAVVLASALGAVAQSDSLGDYARAVRQEKRPAAKMVYTNDNLPTNTTISIVGPPPASTEEKPAPKAQDDKAKTAAKEGSAAENKAPQAEEQWHDQLSAQKKKIADLAHDLDLLQREYKLQAAEFYADAGSQLRDPKKWAEDDAKFRTDIADKQKQLDDAKAQLQEMEEQARQAGVGSAVAE